MDFVTITPIINDKSSTPIGDKDSVYDVKLDGVGYRASPTGIAYTLIQNRYIGHSRYIVTVNEPGAYTVKKPMSSTPTGTIVFEVNITVDCCTIEREYADSDNIKTQYSISKGPKGWVLGCSHDQVLPKITGYTKPKLDADACMAYDAGFFIWHLEEMADDEWVKV